MNNKIIVFVFCWILMTEFSLQTYIVGSEKSDIKIHLHLDITYSRFNDTTHCEILNSETVVIFIEAIQFAIQQIEKENLFDGLSLGVRLLDTCKQPKYNLYLYIIDHGMMTIGPYSSELSEFATKFLSIFKDSTISFGASATNLIQNKKDFPDFFTTVPTDFQSSRVLTDLAVQFHWEYTEMLCSQNADGSSLAVEVIESLHNKGYCVSRYEINDDANKETYHDYIDKILVTPKVKIVFIFLSFKGCRDFFEAAEEFGERLQSKTFVLSPRCGTMINISPTLHHHLQGMITIQITDPQPKQFQEYFKTLTPVTSNYIYFKDFWQNVYNCTLTKNISNCHNLTNDRFNNYVPVRPLINALYAGLYSIKDAIGYYCPNKGNKKFCYIIKRGPIKKYLDRYISNVQFQAFGKTFKYYNNREIIDSFDLFQLQKSTPNKYAFTKIGFWNVTKANAGGKALKLNKVVELNDSRCSLPCGPMEITEYRSLGGCCWACKRCPPTSIIANDTCFDCGKGYKASVDQKVCIKLPIMHMTTTKPLSLAVISISCVGFLMTLIVLIIYIKNYSSHIIKSSSRELALLSLMGLMLMLLTAVCYTLHPSLIVCYSQKILIGLSLTCCYAPLVLKTNRVYRIFASSSKFKLRRLMLVSMRSQLMMVMAMVGVELLMGVFWILTDQPAIQKIYQNDEDYVIEQCYISGTGGILNLIFPVGLMIACTFWAFKTRNLPEIFSEIKSIGATMYITLFLVAVAFALLIILENTYLFIDIYVVCFTFQAVVFVNLFGQYTMKIKTLYAKDAMLEKETEISAVVMTNQFVSTTGNSPTTNGVRHMSLATDTLGQNSPYLGGKPLNVSYDINCYM